VPAGSRTRAGRDRVPRPARQRGAVVALGPDHDARRAAVSRLLTLVGELAPSPARRDRCAHAQDSSRLSPSRVGARHRDRDPRPEPAFCAAVAPTRTIRRRSRAENRAVCRHRRVGVRVANCRSCRLLRCWAGTTTARLAAGARLRGTEEAADKATRLFVLGAPARSAGERPY
jgi:hypothetical protein